MIAMPRRPSLRPELIRPFRWIAAAALALALAACVSFTDGGGSDTETLTGIVTGSGGVPAARTLVKLIPADYDPSHPDTARIRRVLTGADGKFSFGKLEAGRAYNVIAGRAAEKSWAFAPGLKAGPGGRTLSLTLAKVFYFSLHSEIYMPKDSGIAYFPGTDILAHCNGLTASLVDSVPMGALSFVVESRAGWKHDTTLVNVNDTVDVEASEAGIICAQ
jgi:hypothetical protein